MKRVCEWVFFFAQKKADTEASAFFVWFKEDYLPSLLFISASIFLYLSFMLNL